MQLSTKQKQHLKAQAHPLKTVVQLGSNGLTEGVIAEIEAAISHHELIKVKAPGAEKELRDQIAATIAEQTQSELVQIIGNVMVFYRTSDLNKIQLPRR
ncbi:ribosome assembly RNA-binding protein YhbY [Alginatibacterium sediminis]|uniref:Ribosome assembly RNA-binding protein YhbY n=1 Tax=Alginatibacterium sediminis TaxID=2164068 RepID=A0A420E883_9ALTE|nr:ribosome assembly RNA-binding protein YhbY [Alginatibacterium sediminis]RKF15590.1 ribosome assembly RNA-binding protein YhbY [Alginatibacterium sediminis]